VVSPQATARPPLSPRSAGPEPACLVDNERSCPNEVAEELRERIDNPQRGSTKKVYDGRWEIFRSWCNENSVPAMSPSKQDLHRFFLFLFKTKGLLPGTIQGYRSALANRLFGKVRWDIAHDPSVSRLLASFFRDKPATNRRLPAWDLRVVLQGLTGPPFEPLADSELHALLHQRVRFSSDWSQVTLEPSSRFLAKNQLATNPNNILRPIVIQALAPTLSGELRDDKKLCPVRALRYYLDRTRQLRGSRELLFVSFWPGHTTEISRNTLSGWLVKTIRLCLQSCTNSTAALCNVRAHHIRGLAASWAFRSGVALEGVMNACSWKSHNTFTSFYLKDIALSNPEGDLSLGPVVIAQQCIRV